jgi:8-oxo-dGTP diphosphatase
MLIDRSKADGETNNNGVEYALPGDLIYTDENLDEAALRVLRELTGLKNIFLEQFGAFGDPDRLTGEEDQKWLNAIRAHPEARVVTIAYYALVNMHDYEPVAASFAASAQWVPLDDVNLLPFDHNKILDAALHQLNLQLKTRPVGFNLLPDKFTLAQLQRLYEVILNKRLDKRNFRRKILKIGMLRKLDEKQSGVAHKPASFYSFDLDKYRELINQGFDNFGF